MSEVATGNDVEQRVRAVVAEALALDLGKVRLDSNLMEELGAESLDFLDVVFRLERDFSIEITRGEMERAARGGMTPEQFAPGGVISEEGLATLRQLMPEAEGRIVAGLRPSQILTLFTVQTFANLVVGKQQGRTL